VGGYGSGKTEVAINFARTLRSSGVQPVHLVDLDVVNPYFRSREAIHALAKEDVLVVAPYGDHYYSDQPLILPEVRGLLANPPGKVVLDVGGNDVGCLALSSLRDVLPEKSFELWVVLNARRPFTESLNGSIQIIREIESASGLRPTGIVSNTHLLHLTTPEIILSGLALARSVSKELHLPVVFLSVPEQLKDRIPAAERECPLIPMQLTMRRPWEKPNA
jgi:hypothetical protein